MDSDVDDPIVWVRRQWDNWMRAAYHLSDIEDPRWDRISGGVRAPTPQPFIHGYVLCDAMVEGELNHTCLHGPPPHRIKVSIVKKDNRPEAWKRVIALVGSKPK